MKSYEEMLCDLAEWMHYDRKFNDGDFDTSYGYRKAIAFAFDKTDKEIVEDVKLFCSETLYR